MNSDGKVASGGASLAHAWSTGPTSALTSYVLGIQPVKAGYQTWTVAPHPGDVAWAEGQVGTPYGSLKARWTNTRGHVTLRLTVPAGTTGTVVLPAGHGAPRVNGTLVPGARTLRLSGGIYTIAV